MLANGVSIENVAKMLGHSDTKMTCHYAQILDSSIMRDMEKVQDNIRFAWFFVCKEFMLLIGCVKCYEMRIFKAIYGMLVIHTDLDITRIYVCNI